MSGWTMAWLAWGLVFAVIEGPAVWRRAKGDTLSEQVWWLQRRRLFGVPVGRLAFGVFWTWLSLHFLTGC